MLTVYLWEADEAFTFELLGGKVKGWLVEGAPAAGAPVDDTAASAAAPAAAPVPYSGGRSGHVTMRTVLGLGVAPAVIPPEARSRGANAPHAAVHSTAGLPAAPVAAQAEPQPATGSAEAATQT